MGTTGKRSLTKLSLILLLCLAAAGFYLWSDAGGQESKAVVKWLYPPTYYYANSPAYDGNDFSEGRAWVRELDSGSWSLLDDKGNVLKKNFEAIVISKYEGGLAMLSPMEGDGIGFLDRSGNIAVPPDNYGKGGVMYGDGLIAKDASNNPSRIGEFLYGFVDSRGEWVIPPSYEGAWFFREGLAAVKKGGKWGFIDKTGAVVIDFAYDYAFFFSEGMALVHVNSKYGVIGPDGHWIAEPIYEEAFWPWSDPIGLQKDGKVGFVDAKGNVAIDFKFLSPEEKWTGLYSFNEGQASVVLDNGKMAKHKYGIIDKSGALIYRAGKKPASAKGDFILDINESGEHILIDKNGKRYVLPPDFKYPLVSIAPTKGNIFTYRDNKNNKIGYFTIDQ